MLLLSTRKVVSSSSYRQLHSILVKKSASTSHYNSNKKTMKISPILLASPFLSFSLSSKNVVSALSTMPPLTSPSHLQSQHLPLAKKALSFFDSSPDPFHAVQTSITLLEQARFQPLLLDHDKDTLSPGGKYYFTKNKSSLIAFTVGKKFHPCGGRGGFKIIGAHTDSPNLKIKPYSKRQMNQGYVQLSVECYGGGLWYVFSSPIC